jgi:hypothetical protein
MDFQTIGVIVIGAAAVAWLAFYLVKIFKRKDCGCGGGAKCPHCKEQ